MAPVCPLEELSIFTGTTHIAPSSSSTEGLWEGGVWAADLQEETLRWQGLSAAPGSLRPDSNDGM